MLHISDNRTFYTIAGIILAGTCVFIVYGAIQELKDDGYVNAIELSQANSIVLNGSIDKEWLLTEQGKLFCVSLASKEIVVVDVNNGSVIKTIDLGRKFKEVKVVNGDKEVYFVLGYQNVARGNISTLECEMIECDKLNGFENNFVYLRGNKLITSDILMDLKIFNMSTSKLDFSERVEAFNRIQIYNDMIYCWGSGDSLYVYDISNLDLVWEYVESTQHENPGIAFYENKVVFNNVHDTYVFDAKTGEKIHQYPLHAQDIEIVDGKMFSVLWGKSMSRVDPDNGRILWSTEVARNGFKVIDQYVLVNNRSETKLKKYNVTDGSLVWANTFIDEYLEELIVYNDYYVIKSGEGAIHIVNADTGQELWRYKVGPFNDDNSNYRVYKNHLILTDGGKEIKIYELPN